jgi:hypothetical protein
MPFEHHQHVRPRVCLSIKDVLSILFCGERVGVKLVKDKFSELNYVRLERGEEIVLFPNTDWLKMYPW